MGHLIILLFLLLPNCCQNQTELRPFATPPHVSMSQRACTLLSVVVLFMQIAAGTACNRLQMTRQFDQVKRL